MKRVAIVGGGLSGIAAAYQLAREGGAEWTLFESSERLGGIVETKRVATGDGEFVIECGPDSWVTEKPWARELAVELGLESEIISSNDKQRRTYLFGEDGLVPMPDGMRLMVPTQWDPVMASPLFSWRARLAYLREAGSGEELKRTALKVGEDESVASFVRRHFGDEVTETIAGPLLAGVFGGSIETLSVRAVMPAFVKMEQEHGSLIVALQTALQAKASPGGKDEGEAATIFTSLKPGLETLVERMAAAMPEKAIRLGHEVTAITRAGAEWQIESKGAKSAFDELIVATPAHVTRRLLRPIHAEFDELLAMEATSAIVVALAFTAEQAANLRIPQGFGYLVPQRLHKEERADSDPELLACTFVDQKFSHRAPEGAVLLRGFFGGATAPLLLDKSDAELAALAHRQIARAAGTLPEPAITLVRRWPLSLPQYAVGHPARMEKLAALTASFPGLQLIGNAYRGVGVPDMVRQGREAARRALQS